MCVCSWVTCILSPFPNRKKNLWKMAYYAQQSILIFMDIHYNLQELVAASFSLSEVLFSRQRVTPWTLAMLVTFNRVSGKVTNKWILYSFQSQNQKLRTLTGQLKYIGSYKVACPNILFFNRGISCRNLHTVGKRRLIYFFNMQILTVGWFSYAEISKDQYQILMTLQKSILKR